MIVFDASSLRRCLGSKGSNSITSTYAFSCNSKAGAEFFNKSENIGKWCPKLIKIVSSGKLLSAMHCSSIMIAADIDDCLYINCKNGGTCVDQVNAFFCECLPAFTGTYCERGKVELTQ